MAPDGLWIFERSISDERDQEATSDRNFSSSNQSTLVSEGAQQDKKKQNETFEKLDKVSNWQLLKSCKSIWIIISFLWTCNLKITFLMLDAI